MLYRHLFYLLALVFSLSANAQLFGNQNKFGEEALAEPEFLKVDEAFQFSSEQTPEGLQLNWLIADEYYLYKERFKFRSPVEGVEIGDAQFSKTGKAKQDPYFGEVHVIHHDLDVFLPVKLPAGITDAEIKITYQGCAEAGLCYPPKHQYILYYPGEDTPETSVENVASISSSAPPQIQTNERTSASYDLDDASSIFSFIQSSNLPLIIGIFFLLGIGLTFTPCVFPMIPIITTIIAGQQKPTVSKSFFLALSYVLGMALTYAAAGVVTGMLGAGANVQAALQDPILLSIFAAVFVLLALAMFGFYELQLPGFMRDRLNTTSQQLNGGQLTSVFFIGALSALVVSPCVSAPLAGALLYISSTGDALLGGLSLFALGLGMGVPLILIAIGGGKWLPKAGAWMDAVKAVFGVMLLAVAIWLLGRFIAPEISMILWAVLLAATGVQMGALEKADYGWQRLWKALGLILALYAALLIIGVSSGGKDPLSPLVSFKTGQSTGEKIIASNKLPFKTIYSLDELNQELGKSTGKIMMLDFYADWCISCIVMENQVFPLPEIHSKLSQMNLIKADVTLNDENNKSLLDHFGLFGPPSILFFGADGKELKSLRIVGEISPQAFQKRLTRALEANS